MIHNSYFTDCIRSLNIALLFLPKAFGKAYSTAWCRKELFFSTSAGFAELSTGVIMSFLAVSYLSCWSAMVLRWQNLWQIDKKFTNITINPQLPMSRLSDMWVRCNMDEDHWSTLWQILWDQDPHQKHLQWLQNYISLHRVYYIYLTLAEAQVRHTG